MRYISSEVSGLNRAKQKVNSETHALLSSLDLETAFHYYHTDCFTRKYLLFMCCHNDFVAQKSICNHARIIDNCFL